LSYATTLSYATFLELPTSRSYATPVIYATPLALTTPRSYATPLIYATPLEIFKYFEIDPFFAFTPIKDIDF
jgi:hypothetical protein